MHKKNMLLNIKKRCIAHGSAPITTAKQKLLIQPLKLELQAAS
jgi:hypothetical protein